MKKSFKIALAGNPNCGKTTIFNHLTGARQHVGNYPGVTVECKYGSFKADGIDFEIVDLPGIYALSGSSPEEVAALRELTSGEIDLIVNVIDSSVAKRNLYLTAELMELDVKMLTVFNMSDEADRKELKFDIPELERFFNCRIVRTVGSRGQGIKELQQMMVQLFYNCDNGEDTKKNVLNYGEDANEAISEISKVIEQLDLNGLKNIPVRFLAVKLLEQDLTVSALPELKKAQLCAAEQISRLRERTAIDPETFMANQRYALLNEICSKAISSTHNKRREVSDKIDRWLTNRYLGLPLFFVIMYAMFYFTFTCAEPFMSGIEDGFGFLSEWVSGVWSEDFLPFVRELVISGIIGGVGGVVVFLPNILLLFFAIAFLEDSGYMARAAFVMDGVMRKFGLHGKSFVPLILGFGCSVPAIMATRSIESERDRKTTIMILPLMSCGARLPIYVLIIPAFFAVKYQALMMWLIYSIGVVIALGAAWVMKSTLFKGDGEVYLMELPPYRVPTLKSILLHMWDRGVMYLQKAGTIILVTSIILFIANTYPQKTEFSQNYSERLEQVQNDETLSSEDKEELSAVLTNAQQAESMEYTVSGRVGKMLEVVFRPLGFDWRISTAMIGSLAAKEVFVSQLGILYAVGEADEESTPLREHLVQNYTALQGFCMMLFCLLSIPCLATLAIIKREMNSWKMAAAEGVGLLTLAYVVTLIVYQIGINC